MTRSNSTLQPTDHQLTDPLVQQLARVLDPVAFDDRAETHNLGQLWDQTCGA